MSGCFINLLSIPKRIALYRAAKKSAFEILAKAGRFWIFQISRR